MVTSALTIGESRDGNVCVVTLSGRIDSTNANDLMSRLNTLISSGEKFRLEGSKAILRYAGILHALVLPPAAIPFLQLLDQRCENKRTKAHENPFPIIIKVTPRDGGEAISSPSFRLWKGTASGRPLSSQNDCGFRVCVRTPELGSPKGAPQIPPLRSPGFPVELGGVGAVHAPFFTERRTLGLVQ